ncbi:MAG: PEP-CTERM sorting domain-containing protein [Planctomycetes bacterium]|nr:PEP-CTERM sorting domain-containing protein [Planctomycetota bacterium]
MRHHRSLALVIVAELAAVAAANVWAPQADLLVAAQNPNGSWPPPGQEWETGFIIPGLVRVYEMTGKPAYKTSAEKGGDWIRNNAFEIAPNTHHLVGEEAYAFARLSQINATPSANIWRTELTNLYQAISGLAAVPPNPGGAYPPGYPGNPAGTPGYVDKLRWFTVYNYGDGGNSIVVNSLAHHVVAAAYVNAADLSDWRAGLVETLGMVHDVSTPGDHPGYPVMALGAAVWALASTPGGLDNTYVLPSAAPVPGYEVWWDYGDNEPVTLSDLPGILGGHQDYPGTGSFYWRFDHQGDSFGGPALGYTEDTVFGTLGLIAATANGYGMYDLEILAGGSALSAGFVHWGGLMKDHLWIDTHLPTNYVFTGEVLRLALPEPGSMVLLGGGLAALIVRRRRRRVAHPAKRCSAGIT